MTQRQFLDELKVKETLAIAKQDGDAKMIDWCERQLDCFKAYRRVK